MTINPSPTKQAQQVIFSIKTTKEIRSKIFSNNIPVSKANSQKHLGLHLDSKLSFDVNIKTILTKVNRIIGLLRKFQQVLPRPSLITIYKAFIRPHSDSGDVVFDQAFSNSFNRRLEYIQYDVALAITGAIIGTSKEVLFRVPASQKIVSKIISLLQNNIKRITILSPPSNFKVINFIFNSTLKIYLSLKIITAFLKTPFFHPPS